MKFLSKSIEYLPKNLHKLEISLSGNKLERNVDNIKWLDEGMN